MTAAISNRFDGLPLALELVVTLLKSDFSEADLMIDHLFDKICDRIKPEESDILTTV